MEFRLLGPIEVVVGAEPLALGGAKIRTLLAALLLEPGRVVATDRLVDIIWDDDPPATARALIQSYVSALRRAIGDTRTEIIRTRAPGYLAGIQDDSLDRHRFDDLLVRGRSAAAAGHHREASEVFRAADALWRGPALGGVRSRVLAAEAARLDEQRIAAIEARIAADLATGRDDELVGELTALVERFPTRASFRGNLMLAMYRMGRTADALAVYRQGRDALVDELGIEPGVELTRLHEAILRSDPDLLGPPGDVLLETGPEPVVHRTEPRDRTEPRRQLTPAQLPPDAPDFTGRDELVHELVGLLTDGRAGQVVAAVLGPGGVGKSALTVHTAHRVSRAYPDGQLHVDLRGTTGAPASPAEVLGRFLRALHLDPSAIPDGVDERMDTYRTLLSGRRMLIVLDDAANERQVRPLLPGSDTCSVLVTARGRLAGLAGAHLVELDMLSAEEATTLLARIAGTARIEAAQEAAAEIVSSCGNLPLAIRVAGARLATRRQWTPRLLANRLADEQRRLDELSAGDQKIRASIELSLHGLEPAALTALRRLGHLGLSDFRAWVVARALDVEIGVAEQVVEQLVDAHLVDYTFVDDNGQVRYRLHDLVRIYAREQADQHESRHDLVVATTRVVGAWSAVLELLVEHIDDHVTSGTIPLTPLRSSAAEVDDEVVGIALADPRGWLDIEQSSLVLAVERAAELGLDELAIAVATVLCASTYPLGKVIDLWDRVHDAAQAAARRAGNAHGEAVLLAELGQLRYEQDRFPEARQHMTEAAERFRDLGDVRGEASALTALGLSCREQGYLPEAEHFLAQGLALCHELGDDRAIGHCERVIGSVYLERGNFDAADSALAAALAAYRRSGSRRGEALALRTVGLVHRARGRLADAEQAVTRALSLFRELGDTKLVAFCQRALAKVDIRRGRLADARERLEAVLAANRAEHDDWSEAMTLRTFGDLQLAEGRLDDADRSLNTALGVFRRQKAELFGARTLRDIARLERARGNQAAADAALAEAIETFRTFGSREYEELTNQDAGDKP
jgi:DNA-binding SARP family transcriptional activator/tetratricopeptide (TPR) repeat protein